MHTNSYQTISLNMEQGCHGNESSSLDLKPGAEVTNLKSKPGKSDKWPIAYKNKSFLDIFRDF